MSRKFPFPVNSNRQKALLNGSGPSMPLYTTGKAYGRVIRYDAQTNTYMVASEGQKGEGLKGPRYYSGVPVRMMNGFHAVIDGSVKVELDFNLGHPCITGVHALGTAGVATPNAPVFSTLDTGKTTARVDSGADATTPTTPKGMQPGDVAIVNPDGSYVGVLRGKLAMLYGAECAQVIASGNHNLVRIVSENYENLNSFGTLKIGNNNGRNYLSFKGASDQLTQNGGALKNYTFNVDIGDTGNMFNMRVTSMDNKLMGQAKFTSDGNVEFFGAKGFSTISCGNSMHAVAGNQTYRYEGDVTTFVTGSTYKTLEGSETKEISGTVSNTVGIDSVELVNRDKITNVGGVFKQIITGGSPLTANPTNVSYELHMVNGSANFHVGDPRDGSVPTTLPGFNIYAYNGMITLGSNPMMPATQCAISLNTLMPNSIGLGCTVPGAWSANAPSNPPTDFAMLYTKWLAIMQSLITLLDTHTHSTAWGPSGPAMAPAPGGFNTALTGMLATAKSLRVCIGA
jgi:hypothetical protein